MDLATTSERAKMLTVQVSGGLGNQLLGLAAGLVVSHRNQSRLCIDASRFLTVNGRRFQQGHNDTRNLELLDFNLPPSGSGEPVTVVPKAFHNPFRGEYAIRLFLQRIGLYVGGQFWPTPFEYDLPLSRSSNVSCLRGNMLNFRYFIDLLALNGGPLSIARPSVNLLSDLAILENTQITAVHIRLSDYTRTHKHLLLNEDYYQRALDSLQKLESIWVFSDDPDAARGMLQRIKMPATNIRFMDSGRHTAAEAFYLMSRCNQLIVSNSTFSGLAACQSGAKVVAPMRIFNLFIRERNFVDWNFLSDE